MAVNLLDVRVYGSTPPADRRIRARMTSLSSEENAVADWSVPRVRLVHWLLVTVLAALAVNAVVRLRYSPRRPPDRVSSALPLAPSVYHLNTVQVSHARREEQHGHVGHEEQHSHARREEQHGHATRENQQRKLAELAKMREYMRRWRALQDKIEREFSRARGFDPPQDFQVIPL
jgi:hypothetical protein